MFLLCVAWCFGVICLFFVGGLSDCFVDLFLVNVFVFIFVCVGVFVGFWCLR